MGTGDKTQVVKLLLAKYLYPVSLIAHLEVNFLCCVNFLVRCHRVCLSYFKIAVIKLPWSKQPRKGPGLMIPEVVSMVAE